MVRINQNVKGAVIGFMTCGLLGFGALVDVAQLDMDRHVDFGDYPWNVIEYFSPIAFAIIVGILLGVSIARQARLLKKISIFLTITLAIVILGVFAYCAWFRFNLPEIVIFQYS